MSETSTVAAVAKSTGYPLKGKILKIETRKYSSKTVQDGTFAYLQVEYTSRKAGVKVTAATAFGAEAKAALAGKSVGDAVDLFGEFNGPGFTIKSVDTAHRAARNQPQA